MHVIIARNVNDAYRSGMRLVASEGILLPSRNGPVRRVVDPVTTKYTSPEERVIFDMKRDANPFFHLFEALWMLSGANDVAALNHILTSFSQFSDDGSTYHGAYGYRWRHWPLHTTTYVKGIDQVAVAIQMLKESADNRRVIIQMWDPVRDLNAQSKDIPCNDIIKVAIVNGALDIMVFNRSNDIVYGCYGANAVHMSVLQEYMAAMIDVPIGRYFQISADFHAYVSTPYQWDDYWPLAFPNDADWVNNYEEVDDGERNMYVHPLVTDPASFDLELQTFINAMRIQHSVRELNPSFFMNSFFSRVAIPMHLALEMHKRKEFTHALGILRAAQEIGSNDIDWLSAGEQWISRRYEKWLVAPRSVSDMEHIGAPSAGYPSRPPKGTST